MMVAMGNKEYTLKHYLAFAEKLQKKAKVRFSTDQLNQFLFAFVHLNCSI